MQQIESIEAILRLQPQIVVRDPTHEDSRESEMDCIAAATKDRLCEGLNSTAQATDLKRTCRICLDEQGRFVAPCACTGSMRYIHYHCLEEWLLRSFGQRSNYTQFKKSKCQICSTPYNFKCSRERNFSCDILQRNFLYHRVTYFQFVGVCLLFLLLAVGLLGLMVVINNNSNVGMQVRQLLSLSAENNLNVIFGAVVFVLFGCASVIVGIFLIEYGLKTVVQIVRIENYATIGRQPSKVRTLRGSEHKVI